MARGEVGFQTVVEASLGGLMWTPTTRLEHSREHLRYGSDLTDAEWAIIGQFLPPPGKTGRTRCWRMRDQARACEQRTPLTSFLCRCSGKAALSRRNPKSGAE